MKQHLEELLSKAITALQNQGEIPVLDTVSIHIENTRDKAHGDFASNIALVLAKTVNRKPRELAELIVAQLPLSVDVQKISIAGPGFINFFLKPAAWYQVIRDILQQGESYGRLSLGKNQKIHLEFVSSNPTGPLHVGHGRGAAYGAALANLLEYAGYTVHREYYVNDGGRQMDILATSVWLRYLSLCGEQLAFPSNGYKGDYITDIAQLLLKDYNQQFLQPTDAVFKDLPADEPEGGDKEKYIDALISRAKDLLGKNNYSFIFERTLEVILKDIREDLYEFGVIYQDWFSERHLLGEAVDQVIKKLKENDLIYEQDGALWFKATEFGDDKDRVMIRENGQPTYFAVDAAHYLSNLERGFTKLINILGADHHGYAARLQAVIEALGYKPSPLTVLFVQFAVLYRGDERVQMSTRSGSFVTLRELREEVGNDAARFFYVMRRSEQHMDFDLDLAKSQTNDNPVYYVQYAHARISSVFRQAKEKNIEWSIVNLDSVQFDKLTESQELNLIAMLARYPEIIKLAATSYEPHIVAHYLRELAQAFHAYYNAYVFLVDDIVVRGARLTLIAAVQKVLANGLKLLGVSAPEIM